MGETEDYGIRVVVPQLDELDVPDKASAGDCRKALASVNLRTSATALHDAREFRHNR